VYLVAAMSQLSVGIPRCFKARLSHAGEKRKYNETCENYDNLRPTNSNALTNSQFDMHHTEPHFVLKQVLSTK
jgi:hypothetical protein